MIFFPEIQFYSTRNQMYKLKQQMRQDFFPVGVTKQEEEVAPWHGASRTHLAVRATMHGAGKVLNSVKQHCGEAARECT